VICFERSDRLQRGNAGGRDLYRGEWWHTSAACIRASRPRRHRLLRFSWCGPDVWLVSGSESWM